MAESPRQIPLQLERELSFAREDFIVSPANAAAVATIDAWPAWPDGRLALIGPAGSGKTHLGKAWLRRAVESGKEGACVLVDDADGEEDLFNLLNLADGGNATVLITGRSEPAAWPARLPDLRSRLNALTVAHLAAPDDDILMGLMRRFFSERNIKPSEDLLEYLIRRIERSAPAARKVVRRLDELAYAEKREVTRALAKRILEGGE